MKIKVFFVNKTNIEKTINDWLKFQGISIKYIKQTYIKGIDNEILVTIWYED